MQEPIAVTADQLDEVIGGFVSRFSYIDIRNIEEFTNQFSEAFRLTGIPRDPFCLLPEMFGIEMRRPINRIMAMPAQWLRDDDNNCYIIEVSEFRLGRPGVLSLWHEFFEIIASNICFPTRLGSNLECELAKRFAIYITMPENVIREMAKSCGHLKDGDKTLNLADKFNTSIQSMGYRLKELGLGYQEYIDKKRDMNREYYKTLTGQEWKGT